MAGKPGDLEIHPRSVPRSLAAGQATYFLATGIWPLLHRRSFEAVTGRKREFWLVRTVGGVTAVLGLLLASSARRSVAPLQARIVGLGSAPVYAAADLHARRRYSRVYLADLVLQAVFCVGWLARSLRGRRRD